MADERFDGLFMSAIQQAQGIENFYDSMFSFMRRKTDFFSNETSSFQTVANNFEKHKKLYSEDTKRQALIKQKQDEERAKRAAAEAAKKKPEPEGATVEEIDDEEAKRLELQSIFQKQQEYKAKQEKEGDKKKVPGEDDKEAENVF